MLTKLILHNGAQLSNFFMVNLKSCIAFWTLFKNTLPKDGDTDNEREDIKLLPVGIQTHSLFISWHACNHCASPTALYNKCRPILVQGLRRHF